MANKDKEIRIVNMKEDHFNEWYKFVLGNRCNQKDRQCSLSGLRLTLLKAMRITFKHCFEWGFIVREEDSGLFTFQKFLILLISDEGCFPNEHLFNDVSSFFEKIKTFHNDMCRDENICVGRGRNEGWPLPLWTAQRMTKTTGEKPPLSQAGSVDWLNCRL